MLIFKKQRTNNNYEEHDELCNLLEAICKNWAKELISYQNITKELFGESEIAWLQNERVVVGSLASSITRFNKGSLVVEELPIIKNNVSEKGRCDLWAHIPTNNPENEFNFYMEAKKLKKQRTLKTLKNTLIGPLGILRMFEDYIKTTGSLHRKSTISKKERKHNHYVIGMTCIPFKDIDANKNNLQAIFDEVFTKRIKLNEEKNKNLQNYTSIAMYLESEDKEHAMFTVFTIFGRSIRKIQSVKTI